MIAAARFARRATHRHARRTACTSRSRRAKSFAGASAFEDACHAFVSGGFWDESQNGETHTIEKPLRDAVNETKGARRLFDREADNHHAEGLLLAQLAARAVAEVPGTVTKQFAAARLIGTARALAAAARTLASTHEDDDDEASGKAFFPGWAGGATNHGAAFEIVNRACLALWAYARAADADARADARVIIKQERVTEQFEAACLGPAAAAAWRAAEASVASETGGLDGTPETLFGKAFRTYDPCFLLR